MADEFKNKDSHFQKYHISSTRKKEIIKDVEWTKDFKNIKVIKTSLKLVIEFSKEKGKSYHHYNKDEIWERINIVRFCELISSEYVLIEETPSLTIFERKVNTIQ